ncbi:MAG: hypothetical protein V7K18_27355 [Nostoc sp.]|uniref:hypothetical protein n=1 Tax=Nostoc sp. TaxID=1180 RepID=UPI002FFA945D
MAIPCNVNASAYINNAFLWNVQDLRTGNGKSNHRGRREASAPLRFPDLKQLARHGETAL